MRRDRLISNIDGDRDKVDRVTDQIGETEAGGIPLPEVTERVA
jgi:hypothetical protein